MEAIVGKRYRHYKGGEYIVLAIAHHSETLEEMVVYQAQYDSPEYGSHAIWVRPRSMFEEQIIHNNETVPRFKMIGD